MENKKMNNHTITVEFRTKHCHAPKGQYSERSEYNLIKNDEIVSEISRIKETFKQKPGTFKMFLDGKIVYQKK